MLGEAKCEGQAATPNIRLRVRGSGENCYPCLRTPVNYVPVHLSPHSDVITLSLISFDSAQDKLPPQCEGEEEKEGVVQSLVERPGEDALGGHQEPA